MGTAPSAATSAVAAGSASGGGGGGPWRMTRKESKPRAAVRASLPLAAASSDGSQRDSRVSVSKKTTSWESTRDASSSQSDFTWASSASPVTGWPGIGIARRRDDASTDGKMVRSALAAASAFGVWPSTQSAKLKSDCRTGFEYETTPESTSVILRTPQPRRQRATEQPRVPAPRRRQRVPATASLFSCGISRHRISCRLRSTDASANASGRICRDRSIIRAPSFPAAFFAQPTAFGRSAAGGGSVTSTTSDGAAVAASTAAPGGASR